MKVKNKLCPNAKKWNYCYGCGCSQISNEENYCQVNNSKHIQCINKEFVITKQIQVIDYNLVYEKLEKWRKEQKTNEI